MVDSWSLALKDDPEQKAGEKRNVEAGQKGQNTPTVYYVGSSGEGVRKLLKGPGRCHVGGQGPNVDTLATLLLEASRSASDLPCASPWGGRVEWQGWWVALVAPRTWKSVHSWVVLWHLVHLRVVK